MEQMSSLNKRVYGLVLLLSLVCMSELPTYAQESQRQFDSKVLLRKARESEPVKNQEVLQSRLRIPATRAQFIHVGTKGKEGVNSFLAKDSGGTGYQCTRHGCSCHGDDDCNLMFTQACRDPKTNGSCTGQVCTCTP